MHLASVVFLSKTHKLRLIIDKASDKCPLRDIPQNTWVALLKTLKVINNKGISEKLTKPERVYGDKMS